MFNEAVKLYWRANDQYLCAKCGDPPKYMDPLEVSHFFNVRYSGTRFDPENVCPLHRHCHTGDRTESWEYQKHEGGAYRAWMQEHLGVELFVILEVRSRWQMSLEQAKVEFIEKLREGTLWRQRYSE